MKNLTTISCLLVLTLLVAPSIQFPEPSGLTETEYHEHFTRADTNLDEILHNEEAENVLVSVIRSIFRQNNYHGDEELIHHLADGLILKHGKEYRKNAFLPLAINVPNYVHKRRSEIYNDLIKAYHVESIMADKELAAEVYRNPEVYGLTYAAHRVLFFDVDVAAKEAGLTEKSLYQRLKDRAARLGVKIQDAYDDAGEYVSHAYGNGTMRVRDIYHHGVDGVRDTKESIEDAARRTGERIENTYDRVKDCVGDACHRTGERIENTYDRVNDCIGDACHRTGERMEHTYDAAKARVEGALNHGFDRVKDSVNHARFDDHLRRETPEEKIRREEAARDLGQSIPRMEHEHPPHSTDPTLKINPNVGSLGQDDGFERAQAVPERVVTTDEVLRNEHTGGRIVREEEYERTTITHIHGKHGDQIVQEKDTQRVYEL